MIKKESNNVARLRRHARIRKNLSGTAECPRLSVFRSNKGIFVQVIDDEKLDMINEKMIENNIFAIKVAKGIRISICSLNLEQCKKLPALISKIYKEVIND